MKRLIMFGDSLSHQCGIKQELEKLFDCEVKSYAYSSSSNCMQSSLFDSYLLNEYDEDDFIIWQLTSFHRRSHHRSRHKSEASRMQKLTNEDIPDIFDIRFIRYVEENYFYPDNDTLYALSHNQWGRKPRGLSYVIHQEMERPEILQNVTSKLILLSKLNNKHLVYCGWSGIFSSVHDSECFEKRDTDGIEIEKKFIKQMKQHSVNYKSLNFVDWALKKNLEMKDDGFHPTHETGKIWVNSVIKKEIEKRI